MNSIVLFVCSVGLIVLAFAVFNRDASIRILRKHVDSLWFQLFFIGLTIVFGTALLFSAENSGFPGFLTVIGAILLAEAVLIAVIGRSNFRALIHWAIDLFDKPVWWYLRCVLGAAFLIFLLFAVI